MRKSIVWAGVVALMLSASSAFAQDFTKAEVFGGYQYTRINPGQGVSGDNFNGWDAAAQYNGTVLSASRLISRERIRACSVPACASTRTCSVR